MNIDFTSKLYGSKPSSDMAGLKLLVKSSCTKQMKRRKDPRNQGNKLRPDNKRSRKDMLASAKAAHTVHCFWRVFCDLQLRMTVADVNKMKSSECSVSV